ncbi:MAG: HDIG domain-containing protein [Firmicutes bacterium]|nr:HDIG domain-containing protein [Bacillota bacterium]
MSELTMEKAREIVAKHETEEHLLKHALAVSAAMGAMAERFGGDKEHWRAIGYLHDVDFEKYPDEHCHHVRELLAPEGVDDADIRAIESHGWGLCSDVEPQNDMEKCLFTVDELTGIVMAAALMRPSGITDLEVKSLKKKFKDKRFAAKCDREIIKQGAEMLGMDLGEVMELTISGMREETDALGLGPKEQ